MPYEENEKYDGEADSFGTPHREEDEVSAQEGVSDVQYHRSPPLVPVETLPSLEVLDTKRVKIKLDTTNAVVPTKGSAGAAAFDVYAPRRYELKPGETQIVSLEFRVEIPPGYELKLVPRSGLSTRGVVVRNSPGTIDEDYRGEMGVILKYEPENLCKVVNKLYKSLRDFTKNLVSTAQFHVDTAKSKLLDAVNVTPFQPYIIEKGDRIGQLQLQRVIPFEFVEVDELDETERGEGGFGSTGR